MRYPEHTHESYLAAARLGATTLECDVTFTRDGQLVCRHDACDLHRTTNVLETASAVACSQPFKPAIIQADGSFQPATARCCASDFTLETFLALEGRHDHVNPSAETVAAYLAPPPAPSCMSRGRLMSHRQSIELFRSLGMAMAPELKAPGITLPFAGRQLSDFADRLVAEYRAAGVPPEQVWLQSFDPQIVRHWLVSAPDFAGRVVWLDGRYALDGFDHRDRGRLAKDFATFYALGLRYVAPPFWMLLEWSERATDAVGAPLIEPSDYAAAASAAGLGLLTWTLERSGDLKDGGGWYYQTLNGLNPRPVSPGFGGDKATRATAGSIAKASDQLVVARVLFEEVGVRGVFTDWPSTTALVDSCLAASD